VSATPNHPKAFAVLFKDLDRWSVSSFFTLRWQWPSNMIRPFIEALDRKSSVVDRSKTPLSELQLITLHFNGEMESRDIKRRTAFKGKLFFAEPGEVIYSKIDVRNGAIGIVPPDFVKGAVSTEYPVYRVRPEIALPDYVKMLLRTSAFRNQINSMISGASGRKRVQPSELEKVRVPFPPLSIQKKIVAHWDAVQEAVAKSHESVARLESEIKDGIINILGVRISCENPTLTKAFALSWRNLERWSVEYLARKHAGINEEENCRYEMQPVSHLTRGQSGGTPFKKHKEYWGGKIPWVSPKDMKSIEIFDTQDHLTEITLKECNVPMVPKNSILLVVRSGILQHTVPISIARVPVAINQDMRAFTVTDKRLYPDFLLHYLNARQDALLRLVKYSTTVQSINKEELEAIPVPLPPIEVQQEIVGMVNRLRKRIAEERKTAEQRSALATREVEEMILGIRPVSL
jgi:type I restriction enzyme S subunit